MATFDPDMIDLLAKVVDEAWANAPERALDRRRVAERIVKAAIRGERDPERLRRIGAIDVVSKPKDAAA